MISVILGFPYAKETIYSKISSTAKFRPHEKSFLFSTEPTFIGYSFSFFFCCFDVVARMTQRLKVIPVQPLRVVITSLNDVVHDISRSNKTIISANPTQRIPSDKSPTKLSPAFTAVPSISFKLFISHSPSSRSSTPRRRAPSHMPHAVPSGGCPFLH